MATRSNVTRLIASLPMMVVIFAVAASLPGPQHPGTNAASVANAANAANTAGTGDASVHAVATALPPPSQADWTDYGVVIPSGPTGAWDDGLGAAPTFSTIVRKNGTFYFYYVGYDGLRSSDEGERHRSLGVATSADGVHFTKYSHNPVIVYRPNNNEEESAGGASAILDDNGDILLYWAAADAGDPWSTQVTSDVRLSASSDGYNFTDRGVVLNHADTSVWGWGDELFPAGVVRAGNNWNLYYIAKGNNNIFWDLGLAQGQDPGTLPSTQGVLDATLGNYIFGGGSINWLDPDTFALFLVSNHPDPYGEMRTASGGTPHQLSQPVQTYDFDTGSFTDGTVFLDRERRTWFMYYLTWGNPWYNSTISIKLAPAGDPDITPPTAPSNLLGVALGRFEVRLDWGAANDPDTGVIAYYIYRDGIRIGSTKDLDYLDTGLVELTAYTYQVSAVNFHGVEGPLSAPIIVTTLGGTTTATTTATQTPGNIPTATATGSPTPSNTSMPTPMPTSTLQALTVTPTSTSATPTSTPTNTPTQTHTSTPTHTPTPSPIPSPIPTETGTDTPTPAFTPTSTATSTPTATNTPTQTSTASSTPTPTPTAVCPYDVSVEAYKKPGLNPVAIRMMVTDGLGRVVDGATVRIVLDRREMLSGVTDASGRICFNSTLEYPHRYIEGVWSVLPPDVGLVCPPIWNEPFFTTVQPVLTCPARLPIAVPLRD